VLLLAPLIALVGGAVAISLRLFSDRIQYLGLK
jgi:hypothetical protein